MSYTSLRHIGRYGLAPIALVAALTGEAAADLIPPYAIFGQQAVTLGGSAVNGVVASNGDVAVNPFSTFGGLAGGGSLVANSLGGLTVNGAVTFNGAVTTGQYSTINGPVSSGSSVDLGAGSTVRGPITAAGSVTTEQASTVTGNIAAGRSATIGPQAVVNGNVGTDRSLTVNGTINGNATYGQAVTLGTFGQVRGATTQGTTAVNPMAYVPTQLSVTNTFTAGGAAVTSGGTAVNPLAPGSYGALNISTFGNLYLTSGDYYFTSFNFTGSSINLLNVGPNSHINIFVTGDIFETTFAATTVNGRDFASADASLASNVLIESLGDVTIAGAGSLFGVLYAPVGDITINGNERVAGQIIAGGTVFAPGGVTFAAPAAVPEPGSLLLVALGVGSAVGVARSRRR